jgi:hypothetical protein
MDRAAVLAALEHHWEYAGRDEDLARAIYHEDAVLEFPQSGERFEGVANFREWRRSYPAEVAFQTREVRGTGELWVAENLISYDGAPWQPSISILEFREDKVARETIYITESWDAPEWRARWRSAP